MPFHFMKRTSSFCRKITPHVAVKHTSQLGWCKCSRLKYFLRFGRLLTFQDRTFWSDPLFMVNVLYLSTLSGPEDPEAPCTTSSHSHTDGGKPSHCSQSWPGVHLYTRATRPSDHQQQSRQVKCLANGHNDWDRWSGGWNWQPIDYEMNYYCCRHNRQWWCTLVESLLAALCCSESPSSQTVIHVTSVVCFVLMFWVGGYSVKQPRRGFRVSSTSSLNAVMH